MGDIPENSMTREAQQVFSELAQFGKPRGPDLPLCRRLPPPALQVAKFGVDQRTPMSHIVQVSRTPGTTQEVGHGVSGVGEAPRHEIAGGFEAYGDSTGAAMMAAPA